MTTPHRAGWLYLAALVPVLALAAWHWSGGQGFNASDYAQYILHARALVDGRPYGDIGYIYTPLNSTYAPPAQPPGLSLFLAALFRVFGPGLLVPRLALLATALGGFVLAGRFFSRHLGLAVGLGVTLLVGVSQPVVVSLSQIQSDLPFLALVWSVVLLYDTEPPFTPARLGAITLVGLLAILFRTVGVALIPASLFYALYRRKDAGLRLALPPLAWLTVGLIAQLSAPSAAGFLVLGARRILSPEGGWSALITARVFSYRYAFLDAALYPFPWGAVNDAYHVLAGACLVLGAVILVKRLWRNYVIWFGALYAMLLLAAPVGVTRYAWPLMPLANASLILGLIALLERTRIGPARAPWAALGVVVAIVVGSSVQLRERQGAFVRAPDVEALFGRIRAEAARQPDVRVVFVRPLILTEQTGISAMPLFNAPPDTIVALLRRRCITHVVLGDAGIAAGNGGAFRFAAVRHASLFSESYRNGSFTLLRFNGGPCEHPAPAPAAPGP